MPTRGITVLRGTIDEVARTAARAEEAGFDHVWSPEFYTRSAIVTLSAISAATRSIALGSSIAYGSGRSPLTLATEARSLDELSGGRLTLGIGLGTRRMMSDWHGVDPAAPAVRLEELIGVVRALWRLHEGPVQHSGRFYACDVRPTAEVDVPLRTDIPIYTAGVNPRMIEVAGRAADGLLGHPLFTRRYVEEVARPAIVRGLERSGRGASGSVALVGIVICAIADDAEQARREAAAQLAFYAAPKTYARVLDVSGFSGAGEAIRAAFAASEVEAMVDAVPEAMVDAMAAAGTPDEVRARVREAEALFDHVILYPPSFGLTAERCDELARAIVDELAPGPDAADG